jgi:5-methylcytosine-specific restriction enzyme subunit McrC
VNETYAGARATVTPRVIRCEEQGQVDVDLSELQGPSGTLSLNPEIEGGDYFAVSLRRGVISLRARGYVGLIPLSEGVVVDVRPRVPVRNLSRVIHVSGEPPTVLTSLRSYATAPEWSDSLLDVYARALAGYVEVVASSGLLRDYVRREEDSSFPRGRVRLDGTLRLRSRGINHKARVAWFERGDDNAPNRCLKYAIWLLAQRYIARRSADDRSREAHRHLNALFPIFDGVSLDHGKAFLDDPVVSGARELPTLRSYYRDALNVALAIIRQRSIVLDSSGGSVRMPSFVVNMNYVFEAYIRNTLRRYVAAHGLAGDVLDGNDEGSRRLYDGRADPEATPDIVLQPHDTAIPPVVIEVKNVPVKGSESERDHVNQAATYGLAYRAPRVVIVNPRASAFQPAGLYFLGDIDHVAVYQYRFDLGATDLSNEDEQFGDVIAGLMN